MERTRIDAQAAGLFPHRKRRCFRDQRSRTVVVGPPPTGVDRPGNVLVRVADMRHFPIEGAADPAVPVEQDVAGTVIAVHEAQLGRRWRRMAPEPAQRAIDQRFGLLRVGPVIALPLVQFGLPGSAGGHGREQRALRLCQFKGGERSEELPFARADGIAVAGIGFDLEEMLRRFAAGDLFRQKNPNEAFWFKFNRAARNNACLALLVTFDLD